MLSAIRHHQGIVLPKREAQVTGEVDNLAELDILSEESMLEHIRARFLKDTIYTYIGEILVSVNPFQTIPGLYDASQSGRYTMVGNRSDHPPHIFAIADNAFQNFVSGGQDQTCIISGESGAGKTEAAKLFVRHLVYLSKGTEIDLIHKQLVDVNPLLEAFGNARTLCNANSSRFGKFTQIVMDKDGSLSGALMAHYLLEKSRVVHQAEGETNFHVFYLMFAGLTDQQKADALLRDPDAYLFINENDEAVDDIFEEGTIARSKEFLECFGIIGFSADEQHRLWRVLSAVLLLGNLEFSEGDSSRSVGDASVLRDCADLLGVDSETLELALTRSLVTIRGEETEKHYKQHEAEDCRNATAKELYHRVFSWIFARCNELLGPKETNGGERGISILDIFGFECFDVNNFEQLCINLANENLQFFFNEHVFRMEMAEYESEGLSSLNFQYTDNKPVLDLFLAKNGLISILDEECSFPAARDDTLVAKLHRGMASCSRYARPRGNACEFTIHHFAGSVTYQATGFLYKNRDNLPIDVIGAFRESTHPLVKTLFRKGPLSHMMSMAKRGKPSSSPTASNSRLGQRLGSRRAGLGSSTDTGNSVSSSSSSCSDSDSDSSSTASSDAHDNSAPPSRFAKLANPSLGNPRPQRAQDRGEKDRGRGRLASIRRVRQQMAKKSKTSVASGFRADLGALMGKLNAASPHFVRCVKPNDDQMPGAMDMERVMKQLRYTGMLETTKIRREGFSYRPLFTDFVKRYSLLAYSSGLDLDSLPPTRKSCEHILQGSLLDEYLIGRTKVFLRYTHVDDLNARVRDIQMAAIALQKVAKGFSTRRYAVRLVRERQRGAVVIQSAVRGFLARRRFQALLQQAAAEALLVERALTAAMAHLGAAYQSLELLCAQDAQRRLAALKQEQQQREAQEEDRLQRQKAAAVNVGSPSEQGRRRSVRQTSPLYASLDDTASARLANDASAYSDAGESYSGTLKRKAQINRSVRWFVSQEKGKGAGMGENGFELWFHGVMSRKESEDQLVGQPQGTFLVRVAESRFGYSLSVMSSMGKIKHFMINVTEEGKYKMVGNAHMFLCLNDIVYYHESHAITKAGDTLLYPCPQTGENLLALQ